MREQYGIPEPIDDRLLPTAKRQSLGFGCIEYVVILVMIFVIAALALLTLGGGFSLLLSGTLPSPSPS